MARTKLTRSGRPRHAPEPGVSTLEARPVEVICASAGGAATSAGAGIGAPAAIARTLPCAPKPVATRPPSSTRRTSEVAPLAAARSGVQRGTLDRLRDGARIDVGARRSSARAALRDGARPRVSAEVAMAAARGGRSGRARASGAHPRRAGAARVAPAQVTTGEGPSERRFGRQPPSSPPARPVARSTQPTCVVTAGTTRVRVRQRDRRVNTRAAAHVLPTFANTIHPSPLSSQALPLVLRLQRQRSQPRVEIVIRVA
jgi:hypothetical protein